MGGLQWGASKHTLNYFGKMFKEDFSKSIFFFQIFTESFFSDIVKLCNCLMKSISKRLGLTASQNQGFWRCKKIQKPQKNKITFKNILVSDLVYNCILLYPYEDFMIISANWFLKQNIACELDF